MKKIKYKDIWSRPRGKAGQMLSRMWLIPLFVLFFSWYWKEGLLPQVINYCGVEGKAVVTTVPTLGSRTSSRPLRYVFEVNGRIYHGSNYIYVSGLHKGDTIVVRYIQECPQINISDHDLKVRTLSF